MTARKTLRSPLKRYLDKNCLSARSFATTHKINLNTILSMMNGKRIPQPATVKRVVKATDYAITSEDIMNWIYNNRIKEV